MTIYCPWKLLPQVKDATAVLWPFFRVCLASDEADKLTLFSFGTLCTMSGHIHSPLSAETLDCQTDAHHIGYGWYFPAFPGWNPWAATAWQSRQVLERWEVWGWVPPAGGSSRRYWVNALIAGSWCKKRDAAIEKQKCPAQFLASGGTCQRDRRCFLAALKGVCQVGNRCYNPSGRLYGLA